MLGVFRMKNKVRLMNETNKKVFYSSNKPFQVHLLFLSGLRVPKRGRETEREREEKILARGRGLCKCNFPSLLHLFDETNNLSICSLPRTASPQAASFVWFDLS